MEDLGDYGLRTTDPGIVYVVCIAAGDASSPERFEHGRSVLVSDSDGLNNRTFKTFGRDSDLSMLLRHALFYNVSNNEFCPN
jgi:hypothetical protein